MGKVMGIDPGKNGAIAIIDGNKVDFRSLRYVRGEINVEILQEIIILYGIKTAFIERQQIRPRQAGQFQLAVNYGRITATLSLCGVWGEEFTPQEWQGHYGISGDKLTHIDKAEELGYHVPFTSYNNDGTPRANATKWHDAADALLIGLYGLAGVNNAPA